MAFEFPRPATAFPDVRAKIGARGRVENPAHLAFIRQLPCLTTLSTYQIEAAHVRYRAPGKGSAGMGRKPDDCWVVPLSALEHRTGPDAQHKSGEAEWWQRRGIDPVEVARRLFEVSGDVEAGTAIVCDAWAAKHT